MGTKREDHRQDHQPSSWSQTLQLSQNSLFFLNFSLLWFFLKQLFMSCCCKCKIKMKLPVVISAEVSIALKSGKPVVALESTIISHGSFSFFCFFNLFSLSHCHCLFFAVRRNALSSKHANCSRSRVSGSRKWRGACHNSNSRRGSACWTQ